MKKFVFFTLLFSPLLAFAGDATGTADWITEVGSMKIGGQAATDLYNSLNAPETLHPLSTNWDEYRTKENAFAKCSVSFYRLEQLDGDVTWEMQDNATCLIQAPAGSVNNQ